MIRKQRQWTVMEKNRKKYRKWGIYEVKGNIENCEYSKIGEIRKLVKIRKLINKFQKQAFLEYRGQRGIN